jgi:hypothetical protein
MTLWVTQSVSNIHSSQNLSVDSESTHQNTSRMILKNLSSFHSTSNYKVTLRYIAQTSIKYLSHIIEHGYINPKPDKVQDLLKYEPPLTKKQTHALIGKATYYKRFIKDFAKIAAPLYGFIKTNIKTKWNE